MSLFDKDLITRSIDYCDDPMENTQTQIMRALRRFSDETKEYFRKFSYMDSVFYVKNRISWFMYDLLNRHIPEGFLGPFKEINSFGVTVISGKIPIINIVYRFADDNKNKEIQFITGLPPISKV